jgi:serine/threonine protein kinase
MIITSCTGNHSSATLEYLYIFYYCLTRDLKPENLLLVSAKYNHNIKLIDFGLAGIAEHNTLEGYVGSPGYIAPEIVEKLPHGKPADMFSVGVIAYALLGGYLPFEASTRVRYKKEVLRGRVEFHSPYWDNVSAEAKDLIKKLLTTNMDKRPTAAQALQHQWVSLRSCFPFVGC